jgi:endonuclease/exonuclease/phosphatase family metal-dependent hydrolase
VHCVCVHLSLFGARRRQMDALAEYLDRMAEADSPLIIAGDFNDWRNRADASILARRLALQEVFHHGLRGAPGRSFPAACRCSASTASTCAASTSKRTEVHHGQPWSNISDHAALSAHLTRHGR